ncbi:MAG: F-box protein, partial [Rhabdochlamydiaceae bacterium]
MKVEGQTQSTNTPNSISPSASFSNLPKELILAIFQLLGIKECLSSRLVCHQWKVIIDEPTIIYGQYAPEIRAIKELISLPPRFSAWEAMPRHWGLIVTKNVLNFSSLHGDVIAFNPPFCQQSSKFFSFISPPPFSDRYIFLAQCGNTYFLTEQGTT